MQNTKGAFLFHTKKEAFLLGEIRYPKWLLKRGCLIWAYLAMVVWLRVLSQYQTRLPKLSRFSSGACIFCVRTSTACSELASTRDFVENRPRSGIIIYVTDYRKRVYIHSWTVCLYMYEFVIWCYIRLYNLCNYICICCMLDYAALVC